MIKVECEACKAPYELDPRRIPDKGLKMRCPKCGTSFMVTKQGAGPAVAPADASAAAPAAPAPAPTAAAVPPAAARAPAARTPNAAPAAPAAKPVPAPVGKPGLPAPPSPLGQGVPSRTILGHLPANPAAAAPPAPVGAAPQPTAGAAGAWKTVMGVAPPGAGAPVNRTIPAPAPPAGKGPIALPFGSTSSAPAGGAATPKKAIKGAFGATMLGAAPAPAPAPLSEQTPTPPDRPAVDPFADMELPASGETELSLAFEPSEPEEPDLPAMPTEPPPSVEVPSDLPAPLAQADEIRDLSVSRIRIEDLPAPRREVDLAAPDAESSAAQRAPAYDFGDLDLPARKPAGAAAFGDLDLPQTKAKAAAQPAPGGERALKLSSLPPELDDLSDLPALRSAAPPASARRSGDELDLPALRGGAGPSLRPAARDDHADLPAVRSVAPAARAPSESFGDLPALHGGAQRTKQEFGDLPAPRGQAKREGAADLPAVRSGDAKARAGARDAGADLPAIKAQPDSGPAELPIPKTDLDLPSPRNAQQGRPDSTSFGDLDLPVPKPDLGFGALDLPAPTNNLPVLRPDSASFGDLLEDAAPPRLESGPLASAQDGFGEIELPVPRAPDDLVVPKPMMARADSQELSSLDEASFGDIGLEVEGNSIPPSLMGSDESSFSDLELDDASIQAPPRRVPGGGPAPRGPTEDLEEIEPDEEMELGRSEDFDDGQGFGEAQFADGSEQPSDEEMEFGISGEEDERNLSLPPEVLRRQRGKEFEARQQAIGRRTLMLVLRAAAVLVLIVGLGASLSFTQYGVFGIYYWERWLPEAGDPQFVRSAIDKAEKIASSDTYVDVRRSLRELGDARRKAGLNRQLLSRSLLHESLFMLRFGDEVDSSAHAAALIKRLQERSFDAPGADLARAADAARRKQWREAESFMTKARAEAPSDLYTELVAGEMALAQAKAELADKAFGTALKLGGAARARWGLARVAMQRGDKEALALAVQETLRISPQHIEARIGESGSLWQQGKEDRAQHMLRVALGLEPTEEDQYLWTSKGAQAAGYSLLGYIHESRGRLHLAREAYQAALSADPYRVEALLGSGRVMLREKRYGDAQARFESALSVATKSGDNPIVLSGRKADSEAKLGIGRALLALQSGQQAKARLAELSNSLPNDPEVILALGEVEQSLANPSGAEALFRKSIELAPKRFDGYLALAQLFFKQNAVGKASEVLNDAAAHVDETAEMRRMLGLSELARNRLGSAVHEFERALELEPQDMGAMLGMGIALRRQGELERAAKVFDEIERRDPAYAGLTEQKGLLLEARGDFVKAADVYKRALDKDPADTSLMLRYGAALVAAGNLDLAEQILTKASREIPNSAEAEYYTGRIAFARGRTPDALTHFDRAVSLDGIKGEYHLYVARASLEMGNLGRALEEAQAALNFDPTLGDAYWVRASVKLRMGAVKDALTDLSKALKLNPGRTEAYAVQAECYEQMRLHNDAIGAYKTALGRDPSRAVWWFKLARLQADLGSRDASDASLKRAIELGETAEPVPYWLADAYSLAGENAENRRDRTTAIRMYKKYLAVAAPVSIDREPIERKLRSWDVQLEEE